MTLVEIMVVITILGLIAAAVGVAVLPLLDKARRDRAHADMATLKTSLKLYLMRTGKYPDTASGWKPLVEQQVLEKAPLDPWNREYVYMLESNQPVITSYGADGAPGGEGRDEDVSSKDAPTPR